MNISPLNNSNIAFKSISHARELPIAVFRAIKDTPVGSLAHNSKNLTMTIKKTPDKFVTLWVYEWHGKPLTIIDSKFKMLNNRGEYDGLLHYLREVNINRYKELKEEAYKKFFVKK